MARVLNSQIQFLCYVLVSLVRVLLEDMHGSMGEEPLEKRSSLSAVFPDEFIIEIFSWLSVKTLMKFWCLNNSFKTLIFNPHFVQMHLNKSSRNPHLVLTLLPNFKDTLVFDFPISRLLET